MGVVEGFTGQEPKNCEAKAGKNCRAFTQKISTTFKANTKGGVRMSG
jgi:hypothetical protein